MCQKPSLYEYSYYYFSKNLEMQLQSFQTITAALRDQGRVACPRALDRLGDHASKRLNGVLQRPLRVGHERMPEAKQTEQCGRLAVLVDGINAGGDTVGNNRASWASTRPARSRDWFAVT